MREKPPISSNAAADLRQRAEERLESHRLEKTLKNKVQRVETDAQRVLHELHVHQIELEMQNEELRKARNETEALLEKYTDLYDFAPVGYFSLNERGSILSVNLTGATLLGVERSLLINQRLSRFITQDCRPDFLTFLEQVFARPQRCSCEATLLKADGALLRAAFHGTSALSISDSQKWCRVSVSDITAGKQAAEALHSSEETQRVLLNAATEAALLLDLDGRILDANTTAAGNLDVDGEQIKGLCIYDLLPHVLAESARKHIKLAMQLGVPDRYEETSAGKVHTISIFPVFDRQDAVGKVAFFTRDITREKAVDEMKSEFVSVASHELRTPISNITEAVSQIIDGLHGEINKEQRSVLEIAHRNCKRLGRLIRDLLDISRIESGNVRLHRTFVDMGAVIRKVCDSFMAEARVKKLNLLCTVDRGIPMVFGDADRLEQVLINLIENALKFTPSGGKITVEAGLEGASLLCTVTDTGSGIGPEGLNAVFEKFVTGSSSAHGGNSGTGLGLAIAHQLVRLHGGDLWVESESGRGCRFIFRLPDYQSEEALLEHLDKRIAMAHADPVRINLLGIRPSRLNEHPSQQIDITPLFFLKLREVLSEKLDAGINVWHLANSGELVIVLDDREDHASKIRQAILHQHEEYRFSVNGSPMEFGLNLATASYPADATDAHHLRCVLNDRLCKALPIVNALRTVLIVDDEDSVVTVVEKFLHQQPLQTLKAHTGKEALDLAARELPDAILLDMGLPGISGYEVIARLKSNASTRHIPLLIFSGQDVDRTKIERFQYNIPVLRKPFARDDFLSHVYRLLNIELIEVEST